MLLLFPATSFAADDWNFTVVPYALSPSIKGESSTGAAENTDIDVDFGDIMDTLDLGGMIIVEAWHKNRFGVSLGYTFMDLEDEASGPPGFAPWWPFYWIAGSVRITYFCKFDSIKTI